jgi:hypothetical protein
MGKPMMVLRYDNLCQHEHLGSCLKFINSFVKYSHLDWGKCIEINTDGTRALMTAKKGLAVCIHAIMKTKLTQ